jgi:tetratricopeptide (TPR) repeat protein
MNRNAVVLVVLSCSLASPLAAQQGDLGAYRVTGRVLMEDGSPVPDAAGVELLCNAQIRKRVKPYANGDFMVVLGDDSSDTLDIATPRNPATSATSPYNAPSNTAGANARIGGATTAGEDAGRFDLSGCELRAAMPGFQSNLIALGPRRRLDKSEVGMLVLRRTAAVDAVMISANTLAAPSRARVAFENARREAQKEKWDYAYAGAELKKALDEYPNFAAAWHLLGIMRLAQKDSDAASEAFQKAIAADPSYVEPYVELASMDVMQQRWISAVKWIEPALKLNPNIPYANYLGASVYFQLGNYDAAERSALALWKTRDVERFPMTHYILGAVKAQRGDYESAAARFRDFLATKPDAAHAQAIGELLADWEREGRIQKIP